MGEYREANQKQEFSAKAGWDDRVHIVDAGRDALLDPSPYRTRCGERVLEVYNARQKITCPACAKHYHALRAT